jgi:hypothetical protein
MTWIIIILIIFALIALLLVTPLHIIINSEEDEFLRAKYGLVRAGVRQDDENLISVRISVPGAGVTFYPLKKRKTKGDADKEERRRKSPSGRSPWNRIKMMTGTVWQIITGFKVSRFWLDIDTSSVILNANLYPLFVCASHHPDIDLNINYSGNFGIVLDAKNNLFRIITVIIRNLFKN